MVKPGPFDTRNPLVFAAQHHADLNNVTFAGGGIFTGASEAVSGMAASHGQCLIADVRIALETLSELADGYCRQDPTGHNYPIDTIGGISTMLRLFANVIDVGQELEESGRNYPGEQGVQP